MLAGRGYEVVAISGKPESSAYLESLGASKIVPRGEFQLGSRPLEPARFAGAIDSVGGEMLAGLTRQIDFWGNIASVGLAGGADLKTTVLPFILRGVNLLGINSSATARRSGSRSGSASPRICARATSNASRTVRFRSPSCRARSRHTSTAKLPVAQS